MDGVSDGSKAEGGTAADTHMHMHMHPHPTTHAPERKHVRADRSRSLILGALEQAPRESEDALPVGPRHLGEERGRLALRPRLREEGREGGVALMERVWVDRVDGSGSGWSDVVSGELARG